VPHREKDTLIFKFYLFGCPGSGQKTFLQYLLYHWNSLDANFKKLIESERTQLILQINNYIQKLKNRPHDLKTHLRELLLQEKYEEARHYYEIYIHQIQQLCRIYDIELSRFMECSIRKLQSSKLNNPISETEIFSFIDLAGSATGLIYRIYFINKAEPETFELNNFLTGIDGLIFIWDAQRSRFEENSRVFKKLVNNLPLGKRYPLVIALNKIDLPDVIRSEDLRRTLTQIQFEKRLQTALFTEDLYPGLTIFETITTQGLNLKKVIRNCARMIYSLYHSQIQELNREALTQEVQI